MITLSSIIERFDGAYLAQYPNAALPSHRQALDALKHCRSSGATHMLAQCDGCQEQRTVPHSCGHRSCPHCQHFESQRWIERQTQRLVPGNYFLITFTLPAQLRELAWQHQRQLYSVMMECAWQTLRTFSINHRHLQGTPGAVAVLHTHSRPLEFHPHVHVVMPAAALDAKQSLWRSLRASKKGPGYLFCNKALATVFRAKVIDALRQLRLSPPTNLPDKWVVDLKSVGDGSKALIYLGRYLYRGVIQEKDIIACKDGHVTYRWRDSKTKKTMRRTVSGAHFLKLVLQHILPKGFRRSRNYGFLHPNSKRLIALLELLVFKRKPSVPTPPPRPPWLCTCCGGAMRVIARRLKPQRSDASAQTAPSDG
jgi:Putative transposase/Transposase zinc-binding domain